MICIRLRDFSYDLWTDDAFVPGSFASRVWRTQLHAEPDGGNKARRQTRTVSIL